MWIAGSPCSGKSTISHTIARVYVFVDYHVDAFSANHLARRTASGDTSARAFLKMSMEQRWLQRSIETLVQEAIESWTLDFSLVLEDLLALPKENLIVAEGNFYPECVAPYLLHPNQAVWLVPTESFCDQARRQKQAELERRRRRHGLSNAVDNSEQRLRNIIARDCQLAAYVKQQATQLQLPLFEVDGSRSLADMTEAVERQFDPYLLDCFSRKR